MKIHVYAPELHKVPKGKTRAKEERSGYSWALLVTQK